jgi:hypothetical protein
MEPSLHLKGSAVAQAVSPGTGATPEKILPFKQGDVHTTFGQYDGGGNSGQPAADDDG